MSELPDNNDLISRKESLSHVETKSSSTVKPVFKCQDCGSTEKIPVDVLERMNNNEPFETPVHHDKPMQISVI